MDDIKIVQEVFGLGGGSSNEPREFDAGEEC